MCPGACAGMDRNKNFTAPPRRRFWEESRISRKSLHRHALRAKPVWAGSLYDHLLIYKGRSSTRALVTTGLGCRAHNRLSMSTRRKSLFDSRTCIHQKAPNCPASGNKESFAYKYMIRSPPPPAARLLLHRRRRRRRRRRLIHVSPW